MSYEKPYEGLKVIDFSQGVAGPYCGMLLAQHGAEVIKIEPKDGDWARNLGQEYGQHSAFSVTANLGKKSFVIDLKNKNSQSILDKIISNCDIFIEGFRPGVINRLGYGYERLKNINPKLIYLSISGFGQKGPMSHKPAMDPVLQAFTGFMSENKGPDNVPHRTPVIIFDMTTALYATQLVSTALYARLTEKVGKKIEISLMESAAAMQSIRLMSCYMEGPYTHASSPSGTFKTQDGWIQIIVVKNHEFEKFCNAVGWLDFINDERFSSNAERRKHESFLTKEVQKLFINKPTKYWKKLLNEFQVQNEKVQNYREFVKSEQAQALNLISWLKQPTTDVLWPIPNLPGMKPLDQKGNFSVAPYLGQHTREIMLELGYDDQKISNFYKDKIIF
ncbi:CoA transferase [Candidatus Levibacter sp. Uisw_134_01]|uniref:CaiB/BaiF CoA transferase family protein n=1 Tax=Candidatus Levibacter sp. Uisw_134_01 TaxID=3230999 RepID=UPI003D437C39